MSPSTSADPPAVPTEADLARAIAAAMRIAVTALRERHPESFYYVTLTTTGEGHAPALSAWSHEAFARARAEHGDARAALMTWSYADSPYCAFEDAAFDDVKRLFERRPDVHGLDGAALEAELQLRLRAMEAGIAALDAQAFFGTGAARHGVVVNAEIMPPDVGNTERARRLNPPDALEAWLREAAEER